MSGKTFACGICARIAGPERWRVTDREAEAPPICRGCEIEFTTISEFPRARYVGAPRGGSFRDRREAMRLFAIAEALHVEAMRQTWSVKYGA